MGYHTDFNGEFTLDKPLTDAHREYLKAFNYSRRMKRNAVETAKLPDPKRIAVDLPIGKDGAYYVGNDANYGQDHTGDIVDFNRPPEGQPGLWCQWVPDDDGECIQWDEGEKFYNYVEWIRYIVEHFLKPWGYRLNGEVEWSGEERGDIGIIQAKNNVITAKEGRIVY